MGKIFPVKYSFHPEARAEFYQSVDYYDEREQGLGYDFAVEVFAAIERAAAYPECGHLRIQASGAALFDGFLMEFCITIRRMGMKFWLLP